MTLKQKTAKGAPKVRYCPTCQSVWEYDSARGMMLIHGGLPSYGLPRDVCSDCKDPIPGELFSQKTYVDQNCWVEP